MKKLNQVMFFAVGFYVISSDVLLNFFGYVYLPSCLFRALNLLLKISYWNEFTAEDSHQACSRFHSYPDRASGMDSHVVENRDTICSSYGSPPSSGAFTKIICKVISFFHRYGFFKTVSDSLLSILCLKICNYYCSGVYTTSQYRWS